ncbi:MAG: SLC13 family permease [Chitinophagaceae bacterium]|nr:MAG: SLC13 family permease [Chitinophagaceae bacterium]
MTFEIAIVLIILILAIILFASEKLPIDLVAILIMATLILTGIISPEQGVSGFSNTATITVAAMFILAAGLFKTGAVSNLGVMLSKLFLKNFWFALLVMMITVGVISAFINNTPVVAIFIPLVITAAKKSGISSSKFLIPLSFASIFGGVCTLIGTSTNILVSGIAVQYGEQPFSMFQMAPMGIIFFIIGLIYMVFVGVKLIPDRQADEDLTDKFGLGEYLTEIVILEGAPSIGKPIYLSPLMKDLDIEVLELERNKGKHTFPSPVFILQEGDILKIKCNVDELKKIQKREHIALKTDIKFGDKELRSDELTLLEAILPPNSELVGSTLKKSDFRNRYGATALAIRNRGEIVRENLGNLELKSGDTLLLEVQKERLLGFKDFVVTRGRPFLILSEEDVPTYNPKKVFFAVSIIAGVVISATLGMNIMVSAIVGCLLLILSSCISVTQAYQSIEWKVIFLLAGALSLGVAMQESGTAKFLADGIVSHVGDLGPIFVLSAIYLLTSLLTEAMSNNASAVLIAPIAIAISYEFGVSPVPFLMAVAFAASASFMTPVGYQTNTMVYGAGNYKFFDFMKVGVPLALIYWIVATIMLPILFPF